ncbi:MAG: transglycosylase SLT domain-containing protein [Marinagarivorans sp.]|nr:transglycosylase SLT domain-containing protein [Marinagarivorans sp.]
MTPTSLRQFIPDISVIPKTNKNSDEKDPCIIYDDELESFQVPQPERIWKRMRNGFGLPQQDSKNPLTVSRLAWQAKHPKHFAEVTLRSKTYLHFILESLDEHNMPYEIALIPIIESGFNPFAHSTSSASGMWQFMPQTAKNLGLQQNVWYDGRRDVLTSTNAALDYLNKLHTMFNHDWLLAIAAYNSGEGTVARAIQRNKKQGKATDFWSLDLPPSTKTYIPKILALKEIILNPSKYNATLPDVADVPQFAFVDAGSQIDLTYAAELAQIKVGDIYQLNPGYSRWATAPQGPHTVAVPSSQYEIFRTALANAPSDKRMAWADYTTQSGDTLNSVALKFNTSSALLNDINRLNGGPLQQGKALKVPKPHGDNSAHRATIAKITNANAKNTSTQNYKVASGDSLWSIGKRFNVSSKQLAEWNQLNPKNPLKLGRLLSIQQPAGINTQKVTHLSGNKSTYTIKSGDSLSGIAKKFGVKINEIESWNGLSRKSILKPGRTLKIYPSKA